MQCRQAPSETIFTLTTRQHQMQNKFRRHLQTCQNCTKLSPLDSMTVQTGETEKEQFADIPCDSQDCHLFYERCKAKEDAYTALAYGKVLNDIISRDADSKE